MSERMEAVQVGVDTGGTFTDLIMRDRERGLRMYKVLSTPEDPSRAIGEGVVGIGGEASEELIHGTTVATNALLERRGARVAFVTTAGFEDLLWMGRQRRPWLYALEVEVEPPLVESSRCFGVKERLGAGGEVIEALQEGEVRRVVEAVAETDADAVVICLLHAYANKAHEERLAEAFRGHRRKWHVTASQEVTATFREYERASTAVINGYVGPVMARYLDRLAARLSAVDRVEILQSHGGRVELEQAARLPVHTVLSGPAGGVVGAVEAAKELGLTRIISFDMGGTSTDVSLAHGEPVLSEESTIGGLPLQVPVVDIFTVGAGGGSIAFVDAGGALKVGPKSAGADPGPAAYGGGGEAATVTDAHVVLGSLGGSRKLAGELTLNEGAARRAVGVVADELGLSVEETARGILEIADAAMARAIKVVSLERGHDPRDYTLVAFGGAGGLHGCRLAESLEMWRVVVPRFAGILSAVGMLRSQPKRLFSQSVLRPLGRCLRATSEEGRRVRKTMATMEERARDEMGSDEVTLVWTAALRYQGQSFSIFLEVDWRPELEAWSDITKSFEAEHERLYGYIANGRLVELVDLRLEAGHDLQSWPDSEAVDEEKKGKDEVFEMVDMGEGLEATAIVERASMSEGEEVVGPAVIVEYAGTTVVPRGWKLEARRGHLLLTHDALAKKSLARGEER